jgi:hypothetical protein
MTRRSPVDPIDLWRAADALYRAAACAGAWCREADASARGLHDLLTAALPAEADDGVARILEMPTGLLGDLRRNARPPLAAPPAALAALAHGLRLDPALFWELAQRDQRAHSGPRAGSGILRSTSRPHDGGEAERAFRDAFAREMADAPDGEVGGRGDEGYKGS